MRAWSILIVVACLFGCPACEDRFGTYITIRAPTAQTRFDRLELYYGVRRGEVVPTTPDHPILEPETTPQLRFARAFAPVDVQTFGSLQNEFTVWIPDGGQNDLLGHYLLAIAYDGANRVGAAELFDFHRSDEEVVYIYTLELASMAVGAIYEWGRGEAKCLRVTQDRGPGLPAIVAIVDVTDSDCDRFLDRSPAGDTDCEPLLYCDGTGQGDCVGSTPCLRDASTCSIGACANADNASITCADETCVSDVLCSICDLTRPPSEILECALLNPASHPMSDMRIPTRVNQQLCNDPTIVDIMLPYPCTNPSIDAVRYFTSSERFDFAIEPGALPNVCRLTITSTVDDLFTGSPHLLVSIDIAPPRRTGFVIGLVGEEGACPAPGVKLERSYDPLVGTCPMP